MIALRIAGIIVLLSSGSVLALRSLRRGFAANRTDGSSLLDLNAPGIVWASLVALMTGGAMVALSF
jgi:hypothetical protein